MLRASISTQHQYPSLGANTYIGKTVFLLRKWSNLALHSTCVWKHCFGWKEERKSFSIQESGFLMNCSKDFYSIGSHVQMQMCKTKTVFCLTSFPHFSSFLLFSIFSSSHYFPCCPLLVLVIPSHLLLQAVSNHDYFSARFLILIPLFLYWLLLPVLKWWRWESRPSQQKMSSRCKFSWNAG